MNKIQKIQEMFTLVKEGGSLVACFKKLALKWGMSVNSVRNFYYTEYNNLKNSDYAKMVGVDISGIKKMQFKLFSDEDKEELIKEILNLLSQGESVRGACLMLSGGDANKMIRLQNKYRAILKSEPEYIEKIANKYNISLKEKTESNVVKIRPQKPRLTDNEINSLFMGLVRLIKSNSISEVSEALKKECNIAHKNLKETKEELKFVQEELAEEKRKNKKLTSELNALCDNNKMNAFREYLKTLSTKIKKEDEK